MFSLRVWASSFQTMFFQHVFRACIARNWWSKRRKFHPQSCRFSYAQQLCQTNCFFISYHLYTICALKNVWCSYYMNRIVVFRLQNWSPHKSVIYHAKYIKFKFAHQINYLQKRFKPSYHLKQLYSISYICLVFC